MTLILSEIGLNPVLASRLPYHELMTWRSDNAVVVACSSYSEAQAAVARLIENGYATDNISVAARWCGADREALACYNLAGRTEGWGPKGRFWARLWRELSGRGAFVLPEFGPIVVAGPLVEWIIRALNNAGIFSDFSAVGAALYGIGVPRLLVPEIESTLEACDFLVVVSGTSEEVTQARSALEAEESPRAA